MMNFFHKIHLFLIMYSFITQQERMFVGFKNTPFLPTHRGVGFLELNSVT
jgi:hypothetical protein